MRRAQQEAMVMMVPLVQPDPKALRVLKVPKEILDLREHRGMMQIYPHQHPHQEVQVLVICGGIVMMQTYMFIIMMVLVHNGCL